MRPEEGLYCSEMASKWGPRPPFLLAAGVFGLLAVAGD